MKYLLPVYSIHHFPRLTALSIVAVMSTVDSLRASGCTMEVHLRDGYNVFLNTAHTVILLNARRRILEAARRSQCGLNDTDVERQRTSYHYGALPFQTGKLNVKKKTFVCVFFVSLSLQTDCYGQGRFLRGKVGPSRNSRLPPLTQARARVFFRTLAGSKCRQYTRKDASFPSRIPFALAAAAGLVSPRRQARTTPRDPVFENRVYNR